MRSGFFNSEIIGYNAENMPVFDRAEDASFFAKYFSQFISNGVFPNPSTNMQVLATEGMKVKVDIGVCYINGYMGWVEPPETLIIEESDVQSRIDRIVARLDFTDKSINPFVKKGTPSGNPVAPELQRDYDIYEIGLADVRVNANVIEITQENITDLRLNTELCGIVANQLQHVDTTTLFNQYQDWLRRITREAERDLEEKKIQFEKQFSTWFQNVKDALDEDTAGHLLNLINELKTTKADTPRRKALTLLSSNWTLNTTTNKYEYIIEDSNITENDFPDCALSEEDKKKISDLDQYTENGRLILTTSKQVTENINMTVVLIRTVAEGSGT